MFNNKPKAVILSIDEFEELSSINILGVPSVMPDEWELKAIEEYEKNGHLDEWVNANEFFKDLNNDNQSSDV